MSNTTQSDDFDRLGLYMSRDVLARRYHDRHGLELNAGKAKEIISHLQQGQQFFESASTAGMLTAPLQQYYGALALARAMILFLEPKLVEANLHRSHGLSAQLAGGAHLEDVRVQVCNGTFTELIAATGNFEVVSVDWPRPGLDTKKILVQTHIQGPACAVEGASGDQFTLKQLLGRIPSLRGQFVEAYATNAYCFATSVHWFMNQLNITVFKSGVALPSEIELSNMLGLKGWHPRLLNLPDASFERTLSVGPAQFKDLLPTILECDSERAVIQPHDGGWNLSTLLSYFAASYVLSMIVRYHPSQWTKLVSSERNDALLPVIARFRQLMQRDFVRLWLSQLEWRPVPL